LALRVDGWKDTYKMHTTPGLLYVSASLFHLFLNPELNTGEQVASSVAEQQLMSSALRRTILSAAERDPSSVAEQQLMSSALRRTILSAAERDPLSVAEQQLMSSALRHTVQH